MIVRVGQVGFPSRHKVFPQKGRSLSRIVASVTNASDRSKAHLHQTEHPNALPSFASRAGPPSVKAGQARLVALPRPAIARSDGRVPVNQGRGRRLYHSKRLDRLR